MKTAPIEWVVPLVLIATVVLSSASCNRCPGPAEPGSRVVPEATNTPAGPAQPGPPPVPGGPAQPGTATAPNTGPLAAVPAAGRVHRPTGDRRCLYSGRFEACGILDSTLFALPRPPAVAATDRSLRNVVEIARADEKLANPVERHALEFLRSVLPPGPELVAPPVDPRLQHLERIHDLLIVPAAKIPSQYFNRPGAGTAFSLADRPGIGRVFFADRPMSGPVVITDVLLIRFVAPAEESMGALTSRPEFELIDKLRGPDRTYRIRNLSGTDSIDVSHHLEGLATVEACQPDVRMWVENQAEPRNEPRFGDQWYLENLETPGADLNAAEAWRVTTGDAATTIAVLDSGFYPGHPDLAGRVVHAWDYASKTADVSEGSDPTHGQAMAGFALAAANGDGIVGVCPDCTGILISLLYDAGTLTEALHEARDRGAEVINISANWGLADPTVSAALASVETSVPIFAAAGNYGLTTAECTAVACAGTVAFPASAVYAVGGIDCTNRVFRDQQYGDHELDIVAPTRQWDDTCGMVALGATGVITGFGGTSSATALVAGVAALILSVRPDLTPAQVYAVLSETAVPADPVACPATGYNEMCGGGKVDAGRAVLAALELPRD